jgi:hypothetical protein
MALTVTATCTACGQKVDVSNGSIHHACPVRPATRLNGIYTVQRIDEVPVHVLDQRTYFPMPPGRIDLD